MKVNFERFKFDTARGIKLNELSFTRSADFTCTALEGKSLFQNLMCTSCV